MFVRGVSRRWFVNTVGGVFLVLLISITTLSISVATSTYNNIEQALTGRVEELLNVLSLGRGYKTSSEFTAITTDYIESFPDKDIMEIMALDRTGRVLITSTGFEPDRSQEMPDYILALNSENNAGEWVGDLNTGERVMAITRVVRDDSSALIGSVRYMVSMERADQRIFTVIMALVVFGILILLLLIFSGVIFMRSILTPLRELSATARQIARGEFDVRVERSRDMEIAQLCDSINDMAGELGASEKLKNDFISSVSHELRTPLTSIQGWAETLQQGADETTMEQGLNVIIRESERLSGLVEELLDFSRIQSGRMRLVASRIELLSELDEMVYMFTDRARTENKKLHYEETPTLSQVYGDGNRLRQVFVNVLDNALKYTDPGGSVTVRAREAEGWVRIAIEDTGCGIPAEHLPNIKKKFYKANQLVRGSGIGLAVADDIIRAHGGQLQIESQEGAGTTVVIALPSCATLEAHPELVETPEILKLIQERNRERNE